MRKTVTALIVLGLVVASAASAANDVRISQIFGSNGTAYAYDADYVELFNSGSVVIDISGWTLQYGSATNTNGFSTTNVFTFPPGSKIAACGYQLIQLAGATPVLPVTPDHTTGAINLSYANGKLVLTDTAPQAIPCLGTGYSPPAGNIIDAVGYGSGAGLCYETAPAPTGGNWVLKRKLNGMQDTDDNSADFEVLNVTRNEPVMHNHTMQDQACRDSKPTGACCSKTDPGGCAIFNAMDCEAENGIYLGDGVPCDYGGCVAVPVRRTTWGQLKLIYR